MTTEHRYKHELSTGSGTARVELWLLESSARAGLYYHWMGIDDVPKRCEIEFTRLALTPEFGQLHVARTRVRDDEEDDWVDVPMPDALLPPVIEYVQVPSLPLHFHPDSQLQSMRPMGYAGWNETFDLLLLVETEGWPFEDPFWEHIRFQLDKAKLAREP